MKKNTFKLFASFVIFCFLITACDFVGLGPMVNIDYPVIDSVPGKNEPGSYFHGSDNLIYLDVFQEFGISSVYIELWYTDLSDPPQSLYKKIMAKEKAGFWIVNIDTIELNMADGNVRALVTAVDVDNKTTTTTEMIYIVKNTPPKIELAFPSISGDDFADPGLNNNLQEKPIIQGNDLIGIASDTYGIEQGYPKIMFWPDDLDENDPAEVAKWKQWRTLLDDQYNELTWIGSTVVQFRWRLLKMIDEGGSLRLPEAAHEIESLDPGYYHFKLIVKDELGIENIYPKPPNEHITINLIVPENPVIYLTGVPPYYNDRNDFTATITVESKNGVNPTGDVRAKVTNDESVTFLPADVNAVSPTVNENIFEIRIPFSSMPTTDGVIVSGEKTLHVEVIDKVGNIGTASKPFQLDTIPPEMEFTEPSGFGEAGLEVTSRLTFRGVAKDNERVSRMYYALGKTETASANLTLDPDTNSGWHDTNLHTSSPLASHPGFGSIGGAEWRGSLSSWSWRFDDINNLCSAANQAHYVTETAASSNKWRLPVFFKVVDITGNVAIFKEEVIIDPAADLPTVDIISHENKIGEELVVGGTVRVNGIAKDNEMIHSVEVRLTRQTDANCDTANAPSDVVVNWVPVTIIGNRSSEVGWYYDLNAAGSLNPPDDKSRRKVLVEFRARDAYANTQNIIKPKEGHITQLELYFSTTVPIINNIKIIQGASSPAEYIPNTKVSGSITITADISSVTPLSSVTLRGKEDNADREVIQTLTSNGFSSNRHRYSISIPINTITLYSGAVDSYNITIQAFDSVSPSPNRAQTTFYLDVDNFYPYASFSGNVNAVGNYSISGKAWDRRDGINIQGIKQVVVYFSRNGNGIPISEETPAPAFQNAAQSAMINRVDPNNGTMSSLPVFPNVRQTNGTFITTSSGIVIDDNSSSMSFTGSPDKEWSVVIDSTKLKDGPVTLHYVAFDDVGNASHYTKELYVANNYPVISSVELATDITGGGTVAAYETFTVGRTELPTDFRIRNRRFNIKLNLEAGRGNGAVTSRAFSVSTRSSVNVSSIVKGNVYTIQEPGDIQWINYGVFERPAGNNFTGITFVATSAYNADFGTEGRVYSYTSGIAGALSGGELVFNSFTSIADSDKDSNGDISTPNQRYFVAKVYDNTVSTAMTAPATQPVENSQLAYAVAIALDIDNDDKKIPVINVEPLFWNSAASNSLYEHSRANGHIELGSDLPAAFNATTGLRDRDVKISGKVSFRGTASDNNIINNIYFRITNFADSGAEHGTGDLAQYILAANYSAGVLSGRDRFGYGWKLTVEDQEIDQDGHRFNWRLDFDSRFITNVASLDNALTVVARDAAVNTSNTVTAERFDVVPYISGIETAVRTEGGLKDVNIRSADGYYSIVHGSNASFITVKGFNLNPITGGVRILTTANRATHAAAPNTGYTAIGTSIDFDGVAADRTSFTMTNNSNSGYLTVWGGTVSAPIPSLNNINNNEARTSTASGSTTDGSKFVNMPNREADRNITKNILLTDDRYLQFYHVRKTNVSDGYYPVMIMKGDNPVFGYVDHKGGPSAPPKSGGTTVAPLVANFTTTIIVANLTTPADGTYTSRNAGNTANANHELGADNNVYHVRIGTTNYWLRVMTTNTLRLYQTQELAAAGGNGLLNLGNTISIVNETYTSRNAGDTANANHNWWRTDANNIDNSNNSVKQVRVRTEIYWLRAITDNTLRLYQTQSLAAAGGNGLNLGNPNPINIEGVITSTYEAGTGAGYSTSTVPGVTSGGFELWGLPQNAGPQRAEFNLDGSLVYKEYLIKNYAPDQMAMAVDEAGRYGHYTVHNNSNGSSEYIYDRYAELWEGGAFGWSAGNGINWYPGATATGRYLAHGANNTAMSFEGANPLPVNRFWYPKLIIRGNSIQNRAINYLAYYDDSGNGKQIIFRTFLVGTFSTATPTRQYRLSYGTSATAAPLFQKDNQGRDYNAWTNYPVGPQSTNATANAANIQNYALGNTGRNIAVANDATNKASKHFDMGVLSDGRVVIVYLDESVGRLKIRFSTNLITDATNPTGTIAFSDSSITLPNSVGMYVSMYIDNANRIHIAAFDFGNNELRYIFVPTYNGTTYRDVRVDQFGSPGHWTDIKANENGELYIAYYNSIETGFRDSIKLAYAKNIDVRTSLTVANTNSPGVDANGYTTGNWEYRTVPALDPPQGGHSGFQKVNLGFMTNGTPLVGYLGSNLEFSYPLGE